VIVAAGCAQPLEGLAGDASEVHGSDGLGDIAWQEPNVALSELHATELLAELIAQGPLTIIAIGPLTNLATLLERHPGIENDVERVVIMGGASFEGNVTPAAEFNIWADPKRPSVCGRPLAGHRNALDLTHQAFLNDDDLSFLRGLGSEVGRRTADILEPYAKFHDEWYGNRDLVMHDAMAVYEVLDPSAISKQGVVISVETGGEHSRGATWVDRRRIHANSPVQIGVRVDNRKFVTLLRERFATYT